MKLCNFKKLCASQSFVYLDSAAHFVLWDKASRSADRTRCNARIAMIPVRDSSTMVIPRRWEPPVSLNHLTARSRDVFLSYHVDRKTSRERSVGWIRFAGGPQRRDMTILKLSLTGIVAIRASHRHVARNCISSHCGRVFNLMWPGKTIMKWIFMIDGIAQLCFVV